jgi:hypothetical protein
LYPTLYQLENQKQSFGQGMQGYAKRFATSYCDQTIGNMMTEGFVPALIHADPRYFRLGEGSTAHGLQLRGVGRQCRDARDNAEKLMVQCATDAFSNALKEFWPDVKRKFTKRK